MAVRLQVSDNAQRASARMRTEHPRALLAETLPLVYPSCRSQAQCNPVWRTATCRTHASEAWWQGPLGRVEVKFDGGNKPFARAGFQSARCTADREGKTRLWSISGAGSAARRGLPGFIHSVHGSRPTVRVRVTDAPPAVPWSTGGPTQRYATRPLELRVGEHDPATMFNSNDDRSASNRPPVPARLQLCDRRPSARRDAGPSSPR
jgi:hypothetical protein